MVGGLAFGQLLLDKGHRLAVLAVDPSSPVAGGSIMGDGQVALILDVSGLRDLETARRSGDDPDGGGRQVAGEAEEQAA